MTGAAPAAREPTVPFGELLDQLYPIKKSDAKPGDLGITFKLITVELYPIKKSDAKPGD
jgi:hypothetical protein